jgi:hypothetical protein
MFTGARTVSSESTRRAPRERGIATLRIYNSADFPFGWVYEEAVLGAYKPSASGNPVIVASGGSGRAPQQFALYPETRYVRHLGAMSAALRALFEDTEPGSVFFMRDRKMLRLANDQVKSTVFSLPVWVAAKASGPQPSAKAPPLPSGVKMCRHSLFSDSAGQVKAILAADRNLSLFDAENGERAGQPAA